MAKHTHSRISSMNAAILPSINSSSSLNPVTRSEGDAEVIENDKRDGSRGRATSTGLYQPQRPPGMAGQPAFFHALLRPAILQILRATGYHATKGAVLDAVTDLAARYMILLCERTASHAMHNHGDAGDYDIPELRMALQDAGALQPERAQTEQRWRGMEDVRGVEEFLAWFAGPKMRELMEMGRGDDESDATDYLSALKKKHSKTGDDAKFHGTLLGKPLDHGAEVLIEGGPISSIEEWIAQRSSAYLNATREPDEQDQVHMNGGPSLSPASAVSSGLSYVGDRLDGEVTQGMELT